MAVVYGRGPFTPQVTPGAFNYANVGSLGEGEHVGCGKNRINLPREPGGILGVKEWQLNLSSQGLTLGWTLESPRGLGLGSEPRK